MLTMLWRVRVSKSYFYMTRTIVRTAVCLAVIATSPVVFAADTAKEIKAAAPVPGRYMYAVDGGGGLTKFDSVTGRRVVRYDLEARTGELKIPPTSGKGAPDGCLASQALYDRASGRFYTVVAKQYQAKADGTKDFEALAFTVPGLRLAGHWPAGDNVNAENEPKIESVVGEKPRVVDDAHAAETKLDTVALGLSAQPFENRIMERTGSVVLLDLLAGDSNGGIRMAVAQLKAKKLVKQLPPLSGFLHLTPGGGYLVAKREDADAFEVYDVNTGKKVKSVAAPKGLAVSEFLAIAPSGSVVFNAGEGFQIVKLGMTFPNVAVTGTKAPSACLSVFFANK